MDYTTTSKLKFAKLAGFKKKKPSKPKSKTLTQMKNYLDKYKTWESEMSKYAMKGREIQKMRDKIKSL